MSEWRQDPLSGRWVVIAPERALAPERLLRPRPEPRPGPCPLCPGGEAHLGRPLHEERGADGGRSHATPSRVPALQVERQLLPVDGASGAPREGLGAHELVVATRRHGPALTELTAPEWAATLRTMQARLADLARDTRLVDARIVGAEGFGPPHPGHAHLQLYARPALTAAAPLDIAACPLCRIVVQELRAGTRIVADGEALVALVPFAPRVPFELWLLPRSHPGPFGTESAALVDALAVRLARLLPGLDRLSGRPALTWHLETPLRRSAEHWRIVVTPMLSEAAPMVLAGLEPVHPVAPEEVAAALRHALSR
jgi:UDPglucose--hexose-1-phosphate uridylyltransferase